MSANKEMQKESCLPVSVIIFYFGFESGQPTSFHGPWIASRPLPSNIAQTQKWFAGELLLLRGIAFTKPLMYEWSGKFGISVGSNDGTQIPLLKD